MNSNPIDQIHCRICGSTDGEDVGQSVLQETEGYSACCNKRVAYDGRDCREDCSHEDAAASSAQPRYSAAALANLVTEEYCFICGRLTDHRGEH